MGVLVGEGWRLYAFQSYTVGLLDILADPTLGHFYLFEEKMKNAMQMPRGSRMVMLETDRAIN